MTDTVKSWIEERRTIHEAAAEPSWWTTRDLQPATVFAGDGSADDIAVLTTFEHSDATAVVDAHNMFPRALDALNRVLELHKPIDGFVGDPSHWECNVCGDDRGPKPYPCPTVQAIEGAINE